MKVNQKKVAEYISIILGPQIWLPVIFLLLIFKTGLSTDRIVILFPILLIFLVLIPTFYLYFALRNNWVSAWDLPKRQERYPFIIVSLFSSLFVLFSILIYGNKLLFGLYITLLASLILISIITFFWKISIHMAMNVLGPFLINFIFPDKLIWLYLFIPIIFWARLVEHRHTVWQLMAAFLLEFVILWVLIYYLRVY